MHPLFNTTIILLSSTLVLSACTETVYREIPQYTAQPIAYTPAAQQTTTGFTTVANSNGNMAGAGGSVQNPTTTTPAFTPTQPTSGQTPTPTEPFADGTNTNGTGTIAPIQDLTLADASTVVGIAGQAVDCQNKLPCRWVSADQQMAVTATNADNIASRDRLSVSYSVSTVHDTQLLIGSFEDSIDSASIRYPVTDLTLDGGNGGVPVTVQAGKNILGVINYSEGTSNNSLSYWAVSLLDGGLLRKALFSNIPVGPITSDYAQCNVTLPCVWVSPDSQVVITLLSVGGFAGNGRMTANFQIQTGRDMNVAVDSGASAIGDDATRFEGRTHTLGLLNSHEKITQESIANIGTSGSVNFFRTETTPDSLVHLSLVLYEDAPTPRWNPRFVSVPVQ